MKKIFKVILVIAIIAAGIYFITHSYRGRTTKTTLSKQEEQARVNEFLYRSDAVLLAIKYKVDEAKVFNLLIEINDFEEILEPWTKDRVLSLSAKYGIPEDKAADIILNFRMIERYRYGE